MKRISILLACLFVLVTFVLVTSNVTSQSFEGIVRYKVHYDYEDSLKQVKTLAHRTLAESKETIEKLRTLREQRSLVGDTDSRQKDALDSAISMTLSGGSRASNYFTVFIRHENARTRVEGGTHLFNVETLYLSNNEESISLPIESDAFKEYYFYHGNVKKSKPTSIKKLTATTTIAGYECAQYEAELMNDKLPYKAFICTTTDVKGLNPKIFQKIGWSLGQNNITYEGIEGVPLRIQLFCPGLVVTLETVEIKHVKLEESYFVIPAYLKELPGQYLKK